MVNPVPKHDVQLAPDGSGYVHDGKLYERLTHIIGEEYPYLGRTDNGEGRARGSYVHSCFEALLDDDLDLQAVDPRYHGYVGALMLFLVAHKGFRIIASEIPLWHPWGYGTRIDLMAFINEHRSPLELKTGMMDHVEIQLGAQSLAWDENFAALPCSDVGYCLKVNKDGTYKLHKHDLVPARADWAATLRVHHYKQRNR